MSISRYASRLTPTSPVLPSGKPPQQTIVPESTSSAEFVTTVPVRPVANLPGEPEDAQLTGGTRSLSRRLLALNIPAMNVPMLSAAQALSSPRTASPQKPKARRTALGRPGVLPQNA